MDRVRFEANERVDQADLDAITELNVDEFARQAADVLSPTPSVIGGFFHTIDSATSLRINLGRAFVAQVGGASQGQLVSEGVAQRDVDFTGLAMATYGVWIRFTYADGQQANRVIWDADAAAEKIVAINTRQIAGWDARVSTLTPGPEWVKIWDVVWDASDLATSTIRDERDRLFEGADNGAAYINGVFQSDNQNDHNSTWGTGNDRSDDRGQFGVESLQAFCQMVIQKLDEIQGGGSTHGTNPAITDRRWWDTPLTGSLDDMVPLSGTSVSGAIRGQVDFATDVLAFWDGTGGDDVTIGAGEILLEGGADLNIDDGGTIDISGTGGSFLLTGTLAVVTIDNSGVDIDGGGALSIDAPGVISLTGGANIQLSPTSVVAGGSSGDGAVGTSTEPIGSLDVIDIFMRANGEIDMAAADVGSDTAGVSNLINRRNVIKAWGRVTSDGSGGTATVTQSFNIASAAVVSSSIVVQIADDMADTNYAVIVSYGDASFLVPNCPAANRTVSQFEIDAFDSSHVQFDLNTAARSFDFIVLGLQ